MGGPNEDTFRKGLPSEDTFKQRLERFREERAAKYGVAHDFKGQASAPVAASNSLDSMQWENTQARRPPILPPLTMAAQSGSSQPNLFMNQASPAGHLPQSPRTIPSPSHTLPSSIKNGSPLPKSPIGPNWAQSPQPMPAVKRNSSTSLRGSGPFPLSPAASIKTAYNNESRLGSRPASPSSQTQSHSRVQSPRHSISRARTNTPDIIPDKPVYQAQKEPERLEVQPALITTELPLPVRSSQSVPHTPATPSRLSIHREASALRTMTLQPRNVGSMEFIVPLCMEKRIMQQYIDTIAYYRGSVKENMGSQGLSDDKIENLNQLLRRLGRVSTHIGLEGGGPGSQDSVRPEQEAVYAELSSEKFRFIAYLFSILKDHDLHVAIVAQPGHLHDIVELFLKGKKIHYQRPSTYSKSRLGPEYGKLQVSIISSREEGQPTHLARNADLVIALDETFRANIQTVTDLRRATARRGHLSPVLRLVVFSSVEHLDLCLPRTLNPIDRIRKLVSCVVHTQSIVGELQDHDIPTQESAGRAAAFLLRGGTPASWTIPVIRPIQNIPIMESDSSLSDAMSDVSATVGRPSDLPDGYWPNMKSSTTGGTSIESSANGKRPFDLEYGDSLETQAKKQKMAKRAHAGKPIEEPRTIESLEKLLRESQAREARLILDNARQEDTIASLMKGAETRQSAYEELRDMWGDLHHDKIDLTAEVASLKTALEKGRGDRMSLMAERGRITKELEDTRQQLINHPDPIIADRASEDALVRSLEVEVANQKKSKEATISSLDYIREQYQEASGRAAAYSDEIEELKKKVEPMETQLQHERARRKHERENDPRKPLIERIDRMKLQIGSMERLVVRKEEEIKDLKRGRAGGVQTRGSSVQPRSPKGGSRGVSPAGGLLGAGSAAGGAGGKGPSGLNRPLNLES